MPTSGSATEWPVLAWFLRSRLLDVIVLILCAIALVTEFFVLVLAGDPLLSYLGLALSAAGVLVSRWRRTLGLALVVAGAVAAAFFASEYIGLWTVVVFQLFSATVRGTRALPALVLAGIPVYLSIVIRDGWDFQAPVALIATACCAAAAAMGSALRAQERYLSSVRQRAEEAAASAALAVDRGIAEERLRIARDLHDAVGHEIAVISMNLGVAEVTLGETSEQGRAALGAARDGVQRVLQETQQILDILRRGDDALDTAPVADVTQIPVLVESLAAAGTSIDATYEDVGPLSPAVGAAAYRIAQEALTNSQKYGIGTVHLSVAGDREAVVIEVQNARSPGATASARAGHGLVGMRERAESVGGTLEIDQEPASFRIRATLPKKEGSSQ